MIEEIRVPRMRCADLDCGGVIAGGQFYYSAVPVTHLKKVKTICLLQRHILYYKTREVFLASKGQRRATLG